MRVEPEDLRLLALDALDNTSDALAAAMHSARDDRYPFAEQAPYIEEKIREALAHAQTALYHVTRLR